MNKKKYIDLFLETGVLETIITETAQVVKGEREYYSSKDGKMRFEIWEIVKSMIINSSENMKAELSTTRDVIKAVTEGKITVSEGEKLINMLKADFEINELPKLIAKIDELENP